MMDSYVYVDEMEDDIGDNVVGQNPHGIQASELLSPGFVDKEEEMDVVHFKETFQQLEALTRFLVCTKCEKLPKEKVWMLGNCLHKYCEACAKGLSGEPCLVCEKKGYPKDAKPDLFATAILSEIPAVYKTIMRLEGLGLGKEEMEEQKDGKGLDIEEVQAKEEDEVQKATKDIPSHEDDVDEEDPFDFNDEPIVESTPKGQGPDGASQEFPDVLEETPQNKVRGRPSFTGGVSARTLAFPSQDTDDKTNKAPVDTTAKMTRTPPPREADGNSDEELFRSQPGAEGISPLRLPVLTPYQNGMKVPSGPSSDEGQPQGQPTTRKTRAKTYGRLSELKPPALTPHKKTSEQIKSPEDEDDCPRPARRPRKESTSSSKSSTSTASTKSTRSRKVKEQQQEEISLPGKVKSLDNAPKETPKRNTKKKSVPSSDRKRHVSSASAASSTSSGRNSATPITAAGSTAKEKRNAKGETALHVACRAGLLEKVQKLITEGADVNAKDNAGWTPIHESINGKGSISIKSDILRLLCEKGGDVNALGGLDDEVTPLHSAVLAGSEALVEILLEFRASPNIRNAAGQLPKDLAYNEMIVKLLEEKMGIVAGTSTTAVAPDLNNSTFLSTTSMVEDDPAVMQVMLKKALVYFNYDVSPDVVKATKETLKLRVSDKLMSNVTHIVHHFNDKEERSSSRVPLSMEYLFALAHCMWQVSSDWITTSLKKGACVIPTSYEILGHHQEDGENNDAQEDDDLIPAVSRMNKEKGNPRLLDGFSFYLYKTLTFSSSILKLDKNQLTDLIKAAGGTVLNREPNPATVDPLTETSTRFHALHSPGGETINNEKFMLTSHIILFNEKDPPPTNKRYNMEHVKSLRTEWLVDSLSQFRLVDPENYL